LAARTRKILTQLWRDADWAMHDDINLEVLSANLQNNEVTAAEVLLWRTHLTFNTR